MRKLASYLSAKAPEPKPRQVDAPLPPHNPDSPVGKAALLEIKGMLAGSKGGLVAGNFQHIGGNGDLDPMEWAKVLRVREQCGEHLSITQRQAWRDALGVA